MQRTCEHLYIEFATDLLMHYYHASRSLPACSYEGNTPLKWAIDGNRPDIVALLRSVGASQEELFRPTALPCTALDCMPMLLLLAAGAAQERRLPHQRQRRWPRRDVRARYVIVS